MICEGCAGLGPIARAVAGEVVVFKAIMSIPCTISDVVELCAIVADTVGDFVAFFLLLDALGCPSGRCIGPSRCVCEEVGLVCLVTMVGATLKFDLDQGVAVELVLDSTGSQYVCVCWLK
jgi:hypothetical protein